MKKEEEIKGIVKIMDINIALGITKCLDEHLHTMQWQHSGIIKQKFGRLLRASKQYAREIDKSMEVTGDDSIEGIYEVLMEHIMDARQAAIDKLED